METPSAKLVSSVVLMENQNSGLQIKAYEELFGLISSIHSLGQLSELLQLVMKSGLKLTGGEAASIMLKSKIGDYLEFHSSIGGASGSLLNKIKVPKESIAGHVYTAGKPVLIEDVCQDSRFCSNVDRVTNFVTRSIICVPLVINRSVIGVMEILNSETGRIFTEKDLELFMAFADQAAVAITNTSLYDEILTEKERTSFVFDNLPVGLLLLDQDGTIISANGFVKRLSGLQNFEGSKMEALENPLFKELTAVVNQSEGKEKNLKIRIGDEQHELRCLVCRMKSEHWTGTVLIIEDVTQLLRVKEIAAWQEVARKLAHELKNPLTPIQLAAQYLEYIHQRGGENFEEELRQHIDIINSQVEKLKKMLTEFSNFARLPLPKLMPADLCQVIRNILQLYEKSYPEVHFTVTAKSIPQFLFDASQIEQVFINLVKNSLEALAENKVSDQIIMIEVEYQPESALVVIKIENNGPPISEEVRNNLFKPYFTTKKTGSGLGLAIVQRIVSDHGGRITVKNMDPGVRFRIELPFRER
ncbi:MAG: GAF domain-containing protein [Candidatus Wallbacteria bacterium]|nr:GAF domain-containing protein [Candidatus Wallbacteria bacterium]